MALTTFGFNSGGGRTWIHVIGPGDRPDPEAALRCCICQSLHELQIVFFVS